MHVHHYESFYLVCRLAADGEINNVSDAPSKIVTGGLVQMEGVSGVFDASTMGAGTSNAPASVASGLQHQQQHNYTNAAGHMKQDEEVFASSEVQTVGQVWRSLPSITTQSARYGASCLQHAYDIDLGANCSIPHWQEVEHPPLQSLCVCFAQPNLAIQ